MAEHPAWWFAALLGIPFAGALCAGLLRGRASDTAAVIAASLAATTGIVTIARYGIRGISVAFGGWPALDRAAGHPVVLFGFTLDPLASVLLLGAVLLGLLCVLYSLDYVGPGNRETPAAADRRLYWFWLLLFVMAMTGLVVSSTMLQMFAFWEMTTVCSWALIGFYDREPGALAAAQKAFLMTAAGGLALFATVLTLLAMTHSAGFDALARLPVGTRGVAMLLAVLLLLGAWAKSGQVPVHTWLPSAMVAPSPVSAYLHAASMVNAGVYLVLRVTLAGMPATSAGPVALPVATTAPIPHALGSFPPGSVALVAVMAVITLVVTVVQFFFQDDLKRLLALSTASHLALVLLGASLAMAGSLRAAQGATLHILAHGVGKGLLFLSVGVLSCSAGTRHIRDLGGVLARAPIASAGFLVGALTVTGVPPFAGFWSKLLMVTGAVSLGGVGVVAAAIIVIESLVAFGWFLWVGQRVFLGPPSAAVRAMTTPSRTTDLVLVALMVLCVGITVIGMPLVAAIRPAGAGG
ncbi:MAG: proton-conducting transporter membrane subunit [Candidatus Eisenbacteria bacterium]